PAPADPGAATVDRSFLNDGEALDPCQSLASFQNAQLLLLKCLRGCSSMVEQKLPKLKTRVRFPSPAPSALQSPSIEPHERQGLGLGHRGKIPDITQTAPGRFDDFGGIAAFQLDLVEQGQRAG